MTLRALAAAACDADQPRGAIRCFPGEQAARDCNVAAPHGDRGGTLARRSRSQQPGQGRVGPSGSEATGWHHYDGA